MCPKRNETIIGFLSCIYCRLPETIIEIGEEYQEIFELHGGEKVQLVPSLNDHPRWIDCLKELVLSP
jgi:ferrochelatase